MCYIWRQFHSPSFHHFNIWLIHIMKFLLNIPHRHVTFSILCITNLRRTQTTCQSRDNYGDKVPRRFTIKLATALLWLPQIVTRMFYMETRIPFRYLRENMKNATSTYCHFVTGELCDILHNIPDNFGSQVNSLIVRDLQTHKFSGGKRL